VEPEGLQIRYFPVQWIKAFCVLSAAAFFIHNPLQKRFAAFDGFVYEKSPLACASGL
jgi:hypothetical protein